MKTIPKYVLKNSGIKTTREFKQRKRKEIREVIRAMKNFQLGCAHAPGHESFCTALKAAEETKDKCSLKNWGR